MPNKQKQKGDRFEYQMRDLALEFGLEAKKVPLSGASRDFKDDIYIDGDHYECKSRKASPFTQIYNWLEGCSGLFVKSDRKEPLAIIPARDYVELLALIKDRA